MLDFLSELPQPYVAAKSLKEDCPYDLKNYDAGRHQPHYCWTLKKVNQLRNTSNIKYDAVIQTRCDFILEKMITNTKICVFHNVCFSALDSTHFLDFRRKTFQVIIFLPTKHTFPTVCRDIVATSCILSYKHHKYMKS